MTGGIVSREMVPLRASDAVGRIDRQGDHTTKSKKLWNVAGFPKAFTDSEGNYHAVEIDEAVLVHKEDVARLLADGFTDKKPQVVKDAEKAEKETREARLVAAREELAAAEDALKEEG